MSDTPTGPRRSRALPVTAGVLAATALFLLASLVLAVSREEPAGLVREVLRAPGRFLLDTFWWVAFFVPAYLLAGMTLLFVRGFRRRWALLLVCSILPFLTLSLALHVLRSSEAWLSRIMLDAFGLLPSAALLFLLLALELMLLFTLPRGFGRAVSSGRAETGNGRGVPDVDADLTPAILRLGAASKIGAERSKIGAGPEAAADTDDVGPAEPESAETDVADLPVVVDEEVVRPSHALASEEDDVAELEPVDEAEEAVAPAGAQAELDLGPEAKRKPYSIPVDGVLKRRSSHDYGIVDEATRHAADVLTASLNEFNIQAEVTGIRKGPVITLYEVLPAPGVRVSKIANLADNIALRLAAPSVRIVAPIPGKHAVGIEVPNRERAIVSFREMVDLPEMQDARHDIPIALGKDILGNSQVIDLIQTPHLLIGGATNSGKSVLVNAIICSILFRRSPEEVRLFLVDPKIVELKSYNGVPHLLTPVITDPRKAFQMLVYCISEMERRYVLLDALGARDIRVYNRKAKKARVSRLPYIVVVIDEFADLMATTGKELESTLARLAAMARAIGIHLVLATQRPSIDVITGLIKANIPSRIAFMVANKFDSRIIVDGVGAEKLLGRGDMLFSAAWNPFPVRIQGAFVDDDEIEAITGHLKKKYGEPQYIDDEVFFEDEDAGDFEGEAGSDPLFERALEIVVQQGKASASYIQRRLKIGYNRSARLVEEMEQRGIVGPAQGSKPREILHIPKGGP
jgi:DNA segregation ATPase FtsK/SpoIIIE-like protein